jgi:hypothetical protein
MKSKCLKNTLRNAHHPWPQRNANQSQDSSSFLLKWLLSRTQIENVSQNVGGKESSYTAGENVN